jgi:hypothetical protein
LKNNFIDGTQFWGYLTIDFIKINSMALELLGYLAIDLKLKGNMLNPLSKKWNPAVKLTGPLNGPTFLTCGRKLLSNKKMQICIIK